MLSGRTCLITGATRGIGMATAKELARLNAQIAVVCRDTNAGARAAGEIAAAVPGAQVATFVADLSSQREIRRLSDEVHQQCTSLSLLVHNAAVVTPHRTLTEDGIELQLAVNHLAPFLLTHLLLDLLRAAAPSRIVVVASQVERGGTIDFDDLMGAANYNPLAAYSQSKLANVLFTYALAARLTGSGIAVNCLHPGIVRTGLLSTIGEIERGETHSRPGGSIGSALRESAQAVRSGIRRLLPKPRAQDWAITPEEGARTTVFVASDPALTGISGRFFRECREGETSPRSHDPELARRLWEVSEKLTGLSS